MNNLDTAQLFALAAALGWASGIRLYLVVLLTGMAGYWGWVPLPSGLHLLQHPAVMSAAGFMVFVEFFADKIPGLDTLWDIVHTVIRIPAGGALAAGVFGADSGAMAMVASIIGGTLAATSHAAKTTGRAALNTSPEPFTNIGASLIEETAVTGGMWLAVNQPLIFGGALTIVLIISVWIIFHCVRYFRHLLSRITRIFGGKSDSGESRPIFSIFSPNVLTDNAASSTSQIKTHGADDMTRPMTPSTPISTS